MIRSHSNCAGKCETFTTDSTHWRRGTAAERRQRKASLTSSSASRPQGGLTYCTTTSRRMPHPPPPHQPPSPPPPSPPPPPPPCTTPHRCSSSACNTRTVCVLQTCAYVIDFDTDPMHVYIYLVRKISQSLELYHIFHVKKTLM